MPKDPSSPLVCARRLAARALGCALIVCGSAVAAPIAVAAENDQRLAAALERFDEGRRAYDAGDFERALRAFLASYDIAPSPNSRLFIARCHRAMGHVASAYTAFRFAAREAQDRVDAGEKRYRATRDAATSEAAELDPKVPRVTIAVPAEVPDGFVVKRNGEPLGKGAWGIAVETDPGAIAVEASGPRIVPFRRSVSVREGDRLRIDVKVERMPTATVVARFELRPAGLAVALDGEAVDLSTVERVRQVDVGPHSLEARAPGYTPFRWNGALTDGQAALIDVDLKPEVTPAAAAPRGTPQWLFFAVGGAAVVTLGAASAIALHAESEQRAELAKDPYARDPNARDAIRAQATTANVLFVAGGVTAIGDVVLAFTTQWKTEKRGPRAVTIAPWMAAGGGGVGARGAF